jgi:hypothetical protein
MQTTKLLRNVMLVTVWSSLLTGCQLFRPRVIDPNTHIEPVYRGKAFVPPTDGYFFPEAQMKRLADRLTEKEMQETLGQ